jgi:hypothetical protein
MERANEHLSGSRRNAFWPNGARLVVSISLMFEAGGQPISGAGGVIPDPIEKDVPDLPTNRSSPTATMKASPAYSI